MDRNGTIIKNYKDKLTSMWKADPKHYCKKMTDCRRPPTPSVGSHIPVVKGCFTVHLNILF